MLQWLPVQLEGRYVTTALWELHREVIFLETKQAHPRLIQFSLKYSYSNISDDKQPGKKAAYFYGGQGLQF